MPSKSVHQQLEYAILAILSSYPEEEHQDYWAAWHSAVIRRLPELIFTNDDLRRAFESLAGTLLSVTKPDKERKHAIAYSPSMAQGLSDMDSTTFFLTGPFNAKLTTSGKKYWAKILKSDPVAAAIAHRS